MIVTEFEKVQDMDHQLGNLGNQKQNVAPQGAPYGANASYGGNSAPYGGNAPSNYNQSTAPYQQQQQQQQSSYNQPYGNASSNAAPYAQHNPNASYGGASSTYGGVSNSKPVIRDDSINQNIVPIAHINPYSNKWTIQARITSKSAMKKWSNAKGEGELFSIDLLDSQGSEIRATFFKEAAKKYFQDIEEGKVYTFSGGSLKVVANNNYSRIKNPYELTFDVRSDIRPAVDDMHIKAQTYEFVKISELQNMEPGAIVDIIGFVKTVGDLNEIISQKLGGKVLTKRDLLIMDDSLHDISVTLWGEKASFNENVQDEIVAFKGVKLGDYNGRTLGTINSSVFKIRPEIPEFHHLCMWRNNNGQSMNQSISLTGSGGGGSPGTADPLEKRKSVAAVKNEQMGMGEKPEYVTVKASIGFVKKEADPWYPACSNAISNGNSCNKKMILNGNSWVCERCQISKPSPDYRYILSCTFMDHSGMNWITFFNDQAEKLLSTKANDLHDIKEEGQDDEYNRIMALPKFQEYILKLRVKFEVGNGSDGENINRQKIVCQQLFEIDYATECKQMIDAINKYD